jgi:DHA1 family solute carrier family 18 vesicular amine transporter 1/2
VPLRRSRSTALALVVLATFTDIVAYSVAVPVLPDLSRRLGASPSVIGLLFGSFGVTLLTVSIPMGAVSDRVGRKAPMVGGLAALAAATLLFAFARGLPLLFAARLVQGAADAITWVVGFALIADLYGPDERGAVSGIVMSGTSFAFMIGPSLGGWLYEVGGVALPFLFVVALSVAAAAGFAWLELPDRRAARDRVPFTIVLRTPSIAACAVAVVGVSATVSMLEPVLALHLQSFGVGPARVGLVFGAGAVASTILNPMFGRAADRVGARRLMTIGLVATAGALALLGQTWSYASTIALFTLTAAAAALIITPSLSFMGEATSRAGLASFGIAYGIYNMAWGVGLLGGPAAGGVLYEHLGFLRLTAIWAPALVLFAALLGMVHSRAVRSDDVAIPAAFKESK